jgi:hypothetical protein
MQEAQNTSTPSTAVPTPPKGAGLDLAYTQSMNGLSYGQTCRRSTVVNSGITASSRNQLLCRESDVQREFCAVDHLNECAYLVNDRDVCRSRYNYMSNLLLE